MSEVFKRAETSYGGGFDSNAAAIAFGDLDVALVQQVTFNHNYAAQRLYEIGALNGRSRVYYIAGRTNGAVSLSRILGPAVAIKTFYDKYGDICNVENSADNNALGLRFKQGCDKKTNDNKWTCKFTLLVGVQLSVQSGEITVFNESMNLMFTGVNYQTQQDQLAQAALGAVLG